MSDSVAVWAILVVLLGHWFFDFACQPNWMGQRKSKEWWVLTQHALIITYGALVVATLVKLCASHTHRWSLVFAWVVIQGASHFVIDAVTSRMTTKYYLAERRHAFFVTIGFDQFLHTGLALATLPWLVL